MSSSNLRRMVRSPALAATTPSQELKAVCSIDLSLPSARPMSALLDFWLCSRLKRSSWDSTASSCCCACSAYSADLVRRSSLLSMLRTQVSWPRCNAATSLLACTTAPFRICWPMEEPSCSSMASAIESGVPSSMAFRMCVAVVTSIWSWSARCSKSSRMCGGHLSTSSETTMLSSVVAKSLISSSLNGKPLSRRISSAAVTVLVCDQALPRDECMTR
mmetsp:Transcript_94308/g.266769  ORF Transcript_94308/g.266769 Transcript_94308/m.266769 type:complete len:218 (+) Transcript_94308:941-1594(+)